MYNKVAFAGTLLFIFSFFMGCSEKENEYLNDGDKVDSCNYRTFIYDNYYIPILEFDSLPYMKPYVRSIEGLGEVDDEGVPLFEYKGEKHYHPVDIAIKGLWLLNNYRLTEDEKYLSLLEIICEKLIEVSDEYNGDLYFPYTFDFPLHDLEDETVYAPWYSAMAQGQILSLFVRMYEITGQIKYKDYAKKIFDSFLNLKADNEIWVSCIDNDSNLWLEEYPMDIPCFTLNGFIFAIYGVYDYYRINQDNELVWKILLASVTTIHKNILKYRNPGEFSYYCLKHKVKNEDYHYVHIRELKILSKISGEPYFMEMAELFKSDFDPDSN